MMNHFNPSHFANRRQRIIELLGENSIAIFISPSEKVRSNDTYYKYRPSSDIVYLSGFEEPETVLVLAPGHDDGDFFLFVRERDPLREQWDGRRAGTEGAEETFLADRAFPITQIDQILPKLMAKRERLYYTLGQNTQFDSKICKLMNQLRYQRYSASIAPAQISDARDLVHRQRMIKTPEEIEIMRRAGAISGKAHELAMAYTKPGVYEYQLQAIIEHHFKMNGATAPGYESIVGTGDNAVILHYIENEAELKAGEIVLIDAGCEYDYYSADISRSWPVTGTFTPEQRDMYQIVLECEQTCIQSVRKNVTYQSIKNKAVRLLTEGMISLNILNGSVDEIIDKREYMPYYPHSIGHFLGMDVHDVGTYFNDDGSDLKLQPGMVVTIEPGLYFPKDDDRIPEGLRGVGIRIEDDIVCTEDEPLNLTQDCIKDIDQIEALVGSAHKS